MKLSSLANKFAMKLGLESRPAPPASSTKKFDYTEDFDTSNSDEYANVMSDELSEEPDSVAADFEGGYDPDSQPPAYFVGRNFPFNYLLHGIRLHSSKLNEMMSLKDFSNALGEIDHLQEILHTLQNHILEKVGESEESTAVKSASSYMYEPDEYEYMETDSDRDFDNYWEYYTRDLNEMTKDELYKEERNLKADILASLSEDEDINQIVMKKLQEVRKKLKKSHDPNSIMADVMSEATRLSKFIE